MRFIFALLILLIYFARLCSRVPRSHTKVPDLTSDDTQYRVCCLSDSDPLFASDRYSPCRVTVMPACCALANPLTCRLPLARCALRSHAMPLARCALRSRAACPSAVSDLTARTHLGAHLSLHISCPDQAVRLWRLPRPPDCAAALHGAYHFPSQNPLSFVCDRGTFWPVTGKQ